MYLVLACYTELLKYSCGLVVLCDSFIVHLFADKRRHAGVLSHDLSPAAFTLTLKCKLFDRKLHDGC